MKGELDLAIKDFTRAIEIDPGLASVYNNRGESRHKKGDLAAAESDYRQALKLDPDFGKAYRLLSRLLNFCSMSAGGKKKKLPVREGD